MSRHDRLVKDGLAAHSLLGGLVKLTRHYWLFLAESHATRQPIGAMVQRIVALLVVTR